MHSRADIDRLKGTTGDGGMVLVGDSGPLDPLAFAAELKSACAAGVFLELTARNRNRDEIRTRLVTSSAVGFAGVIISSGLFNKSENMAKPVYDLDPTQIVMLAGILKKEGRIRDDFTIGVRSAAGTGAVSARAQFLLSNGASFIAFPDDAAPGEFDDRTVVLQPVQIPE